MPCIASMIRLSRCVKNVFWVTLWRTSTPSGILGPWCKLNLRLLCVDCLRNLFSIFFWFGGVFIRKWSLWECGSTPVPPLVATLYIIFNVYVSYNYDNFTISIYCNFILYRKLIFDPNLFFWIYICYLCIYDCKQFWWNVK